MILEFQIEDYTGKAIEGLQKNIIKCAYLGDLDGIKSAVKEDPTSVTFVDSFTGCSALHISAGLGNYSCVEFIISCRHVDLFQTDKKGVQAIARAFEVGHYAIADLLADKMYPNRKKGITDPTP